MKIVKIALAVFIGLAAFNFVPRKFWTEAQSFVSQTLEETERAATGKPSRAQEAAEREKHLGCFLTNRQCPYGNCPYHEEEKRPCKLHGRSYFSCSEKCEGRR